MTNGDTARHEPAEPSSATDPGRIEIRAKGLDETSAYLSEIGEHQASRVVADAACRLRSEAIRQRKRRSESVDGKDTKDAKVGQQLDIEHG